MDERENEKERERERGLLKKNGVKTKLRKLPHTHRH